MLIQLRKKMKNQKGFTLVELMVVIAIIGVLAAIAVPKLSSSTDAAKDAKLTSDLRTLDGSIMMYYANKQVYPSKTDLTPAYIKEWPKDAKGADLDYAVTVATGTTAASYVLKGKNSSNVDVKSPGSN